MKKLKLFILKCTISLKANSVLLKYIGILILQYVALIFLAILLDKVLELILLIPTFFIFTKLFSKQYHCKTLLKCSILTTIIYATVFLILPSNCTSILIAIVVNYTITYISFHTKTYLDHKQLLTKSLDSLTFDEMCQRYTSYDRQTLKCVYDYLNRGNVSADCIAQKYYYSTRQVQRIIKKMRET